MSQLETNCRRVLVVDDDVVVREVLTAILEIEGYAVQVAESGDAALVLLADGMKVDVILVDLHMPGVRGAELVARLNAVRAVETIVIGMSASKLNPAEVGLFGAYLQKPFTAQDFAAAIEAAAARVGSSAGVGAVGNNKAPEAAVFDERIFERLAAMLGPTQMRELYRITIEDVRRRVDLMRKSLHLGIGEETRAEAHAIKGGCGMVGASELSSLAAAIEGGSDPGNPPFADFDAACGRLQDMLDARFRYNVEQGPTEKSKDVD